MYLLACLAPVYLTAQPANDDCQNAIEIPISNNNFALGTFSTAPIQIEDATQQPGTYYLDANDHAKDIWYWFYLPTARYGKIELLQTNNNIPPDDLGFITYLPPTSDCPPLPDWIDPAKLTPVPQQGSTDTECLDPGTYFVQVTFSETAAGNIYLELTLDDPFGATPALDPPFDHPDVAPLLGAQPELIDIGCHTIDSAEEFACFSTAQPETLNQSIWARFQSGNFNDYLAIVLQTTENSSDTLLPDEVGIRLMEGDVTQNDWTTLPVVADCSIFDVGGPTLRYKEFFCEVTQPNTVYSVALYFPQGYTTSQVELSVCRRGGHSTGAPVPILSQMAFSNQLGILPSSWAGTTTFLVDSFTCKASLSLSQNQCGTVNPPDYVTITDTNQTVQLQYVTWAGFELAEEAEVHFYFSDTSKYKYARIFDKAHTENCGAIDATSDLLVQFNSGLTIPCLSPGGYAIQILGGNPPAATWSCDQGQLGYRIQLNMTVKNQVSVNKFGLTDALAFEPINNLDPLEPGEWYFTEKDSFGCHNTVLIDGGTCTDRPKIMVREFYIDEPGVLFLSNLSMSGQYDFHYKLYSGSIADLAAAQNAYTDADLITGANEYLGGCIDQQGSGSGNYYCLLAGHYSLVTFGDVFQQNKTNDPIIVFYNWDTSFDDPAQPNAMGDVTTPGEYDSEIDYYSCDHNALTIGGLAPCGGFDSIQQIYRTFYLAEPRVVAIQSAGGTPFSLFQGNIANGTGNLIPWLGDNTFSESWYPCVATQQTSDCDPLTPGYYTVVAYGVVPDYTDPSLNGTSGFKGSLGIEHRIKLTIQLPEEVPCNRPEKTCFANGGDPVDWDYDALSDLCPFTKKVYSLDTVEFNCVPDTPFADHPIEPCESSNNRTAYYGFKLSYQSYIAIRGIPNVFDVQLFGFDASLFPELLIQEEPVADCNPAAFPERGYCNVPPGTYTLVVFAEDQHAGERLTPTLIVERVVDSRFDHWANAYDFGLVPNDNVFIDGKPGDVNPLNADLAPSVDYIGCTTSGSPTDPLEGVCCTEYNPLIDDGPYNAEFDNTTSSTLVHSLRNIIYTFVLSGPGTCTVSARNCLSPAWSERPHIAIYKSDSGAIPFEDLQANGGIDSTLADGLSLVAHNTTVEPCDETCFPFRWDVLSFDKTACTDDTVRYYVVVSKLNGGTLNQQIRVKVKHEGVPWAAVQFDEYTEAGSPVDPSPAAIIDTLAGGYHCGEAVSFQCATANETDPVIGNCEPEHTVWYRFFAPDGGNFHLSYANADTPDDLDLSPHMKLYRATEPIAFDSLAEVPLSLFPYNDPNNATGQSWYRACIEAGEYYLFWPECNDLDIYALYRPCLYFESHPGDYCYNAVPLDMPGEGTASATVVVDCHTIGTDILDGPDSYECLPGPEGYKSSFFVLNLTGPEKRDVTFSMEELTSADPWDIRYRVLPGYCGALTPGLCSPDPNTSFTLNCLGPGTYIIQVVTIEDALGEINFTVTATNSPDQDCIPLDPLHPNAFFEYDPCHPNTVYLTNLSTFGPDIEYEWRFPDYSTFVKNPRYVYAPQDYVQVVDVVLMVRNVANGLSDEFSLTLEIPPHVEPLPAEKLLLCPADSVVIQAYSFDPDADFDWSNGADSSRIVVGEPGMLWLTVSDLFCTLTDSVLIAEVYCDSVRYEVCDSLWYGSRRIVSNTVFSDTLSGAPALDTLRQVTVDIHTVGVVEIVPAEQQIELGEEIGLEVFTNAVEPVFVWEPEGSFELVNERRIRALPTDDRVYSVLVEDADGCLARAYAVVRVAKVYDGVYFPNAFSPNGDGVNDVFHPFGVLPALELVDFRIFDRWGAEVFHRSNVPFDAANGWDGRFLDQDAPSGVYTWLAKVAFIDGEVVLLDGDVTILR